MPPWPMESAPLVTAVSGRNDWIGKSSGVSHATWRSRREMLRQYRVQQPGGGDQNSSVADSWKVAASRGKLNCSYCQSDDDSDDEHGTDGGQHEQAANDDSSAAKNTSVRHRLLVAGSGVLLSFSKRRQALIVVWAEQVVGARLVVARKQVCIISNVFFKSPQPVCFVANELVY